MSIKKKWDGDLLDRKEVSIFLQKLVDAQYKNKTISNGKSLCFAIDGEWGSGKSFFVEKWAQDLNNQGNYHVITFDAWKNDLSDDPLLGFMSSIRDEIKILYDKLPIADQGAGQLSEGFSDFVRKAGKAVLPAGGLIVKGLLKKYVADEIEDISSGFFSEDGVKINEGIGGLSDAAIDKYFESAMQSHREKTESIIALIESIELVLSRLQELNLIDLPLYIFVDELDRCRPDYAIRLLEGIKHIFNARGVCFVVSTNLVQLAESVKAVYGSGFESRRYLKRFFDFEYRLPEPCIDEFVLKLVSDSYVFNKSNRPYFSALPDAEDGTRKNVVDDFMAVAKAFNIDLRSQKQVFNISEAAAAGLNDKYVLHGLYLFGLAALMHVSPSVFEMLINRSDFGDLSGVEGFVDFKFEYWAVSDMSNPRSGREKRSYAYSNLFAKYRSISSKTAGDIRSSLDRLDYSVSYPQHIIGELFGEFRGQYNRDSYHSIRNYPDLVRLSGGLKF